ncbi:MAG TPA: TfoX/Sxy family protein [Vicinamibacteria bacterium]
MPVSRAFLQHALDLLAPGGPVQARPMFGGYGLFHRGAIFGLLDDDELYLKTDDANRRAFVDAGCRQWVYPSPKGPMPTSYYRPPDAAMEDPEEMVPWARLAREAGARKQAATGAKAKARSGRSRSRSRSRSGSRPKSRPRSR